MVSSGLVFMPNGTHTRGLRLRGQFGSQLLDNKLEQSPLMWVLRGCMGRSEDFEWNLGHVYIQDRKSEVELSEGGIRETWEDQRRLLECKEKFLKKGPVVLQRNLSKGPSRP